MSPEMVKDFSTVYVLKILYRKYNNDNIYIILYKN